MKISERWLREWVNPVLNCEHLCAQLTMSGLEVESITAVEEHVESVNLPANDNVIDISVTPNRGDCLSIRGLAKEIAALTQTPYHPLNIPDVLPVHQDQRQVKIESIKDCPRYVGRVIRHINNAAATPIWLQERLRLSDINTISPAVDVMNYVMLELGQPMHAFDLQHIDQHIVVRKAKEKEKLTLLDGQEIQLSENTLIIADSNKPLAIAGVMGGLDSAVTLMTKDVFLESAFFQPTTVARSSRHYKLTSDSSSRFERGIDPDIQAAAIQRATELLIEIAGGEPGPLVELNYPDHLSQPAHIILRRARIQRMLGLVVPDHEIENILERLGFICEPMQEGWSVSVPAVRSDIKLEVDLIEEIIRLYGYENLPTHGSAAALQMHPIPENKTSLFIFKKALSDLGFNEIVSYSFIEPKLQKLLDPQVEPKTLMNPISSEMAVMRTNLWPGLVNTLLYNLNRQQNRMMIFEAGLRFIPKNDKVQQQRVLSGLVYGSQFPEQWGITPNLAVDFFDLKGCLDNLFSISKKNENYFYKKYTHPALHPGQSAEIYHKDKAIGVMGALHPKVLQLLDIKGNVFVFELDLDTLEAASIPRFQEISKFPEIRRDLAILVDRTVPAQAIQDTIKEVAGNLLQDVIVFDVYQGKGVAGDHKSLALGLTLQHASRTLRDEEVAEVMERVIVALKNQFAAELRS